MGVLGIGAALFLWSSLRSVNHVQDDVSELAVSLRGRTVEDFMSPGSYASLISDVEAIEKQLEGLHRRSQAARMLGWAPGVGQKAAEAATFLEMSGRLAHAARLTLEGYAPVVQAMSSGARSDLDALRLTMTDAGPLFAEAQDDIAAARQLRSQLKDPSLLGDRGQEYVAQVDRYLNLMEVVVVLAIEAPDMVGDALELRQTIGELRSSFGDPSALLARPEEMQGRFKIVEDRARNLQANLVEAKGKVQGKDARIDEALDVALGLSSVMATLGDALARVSNVADQFMALGPLTRESGILLGQELPVVKEHLTQAQEQLDVVQRDLQGGSVSDALLSLLGGAFGTSSAPLQREEDLLASGVESLDFLSYFLGYDAPRKFLLVGQNSDEIRATGGFLGVVMEMTIDRGELKGLRYLNSDDVDTPPFDTNPIAPEPIFRYLWMVRYLFRDSNWNPHFPAAATQIADFYQRAQGVKVDGVIAITDDFTLELVNALGSVKVPRVAAPVDAPTARRFVKGELLYPCLPSQVSKRSKRCFDEDLTQALLQRLFAPMEPQIRSGVVDAFLSALRTKDALVHVFDEEAAGLLWQHHWNGALQQVDHDYLMIVDSALPGHARKVVQRRVQYQVTVGPQRAIETQLLIQYLHQGTVPQPNCRQAITTPTGCFWDYLRVYVPVFADDIQVPPVPLPEGSEWLVWGYEPAESRSVLSSPREGLAGLTEIGGYLMVEPGTSVTLPISYRLPASRIRAIGNGAYEYRLLVQKQPGTPVEPVTVFVQLPPGASLVNASPAPSAHQDNWVRMDVDLAQDTTFVVDFTG